jgi:hypothetical protein
MKKSSIICCGCRKSVSIDGNITPNNNVKCPYCSAFNLNPNLSSPAGFQLDQKQRRGLFILIFMILISSGYIVNYCDKSDYEYLIGQTVPYDDLPDYGNLETLMGTNNQRWVVYFDQANFTMISDKKTEIILDIKKGRQPFAEPFSND